MTDQTPATASPAADAALQPVMLVADIGGTNCRLALCGDDDGPFWASEVFSTDDFPSPFDAIGAFYDHVGCAPAPYAALAVAGPVTGDEVTLTNSHWRFRRAALQEACGFQRLVVANDLAAQARGVLTLSNDSLHRIGEPEWTGTADTITVVNPGTGLGVARVDPKNAKRVTATEGGHLGFAPTDDVEMELLRLWRLHLGAVTNEHVISGPGLVRVYRALGAIKDAPVEAIAGPDIMTRGLSGEDELCVEAIERFAKILGVVSADLALAQGADAVVLAGGIANSLIPVLDRGGFRSRFEQRGPNGFVHSISTHVAAAKDLGLAGARALLEDDLAAPGTTQ